MHVVISGVTGVGKTTWAGALSTHSGIAIASERVDLNPFLAPSAAGDPSLNLLCQSYFLFSAATQHYAAQASGQPMIQDHSIYEVFNIYTRERREAGLIDFDSYHALELLYLRITSLLRPPSVVLMLCARPKVIRQRVSLRDRPSDLVPSIAYLLQNQNERKLLWRSLGFPMVEFDNSGCSVPVVGDDIVSEIWRDLETESELSNQPGGLQ